MSESEDRVVIEFRTERRMSDREVVAELVPYVLILCVALAALAAKFFGWFA